MRLALIHYAAPPVIGGVERVLAQQARSFMDHGHEVVVVCGNKGAKVEGAIMEYAPNFYIKRVRSALEGCEVVIIHNMLTMPFDHEAADALAELSREMTDKRFINWVHDVDVPGELFAALAARVEHVAVSEVRRARFCAMAGLKKTECRVIPNGVDVLATLGCTEAVQGFAVRHRLLERELVLLHPTRILARKNIELGIAVTAALRKDGLDAAYVITGAPDPHRVESQAYGEALRRRVRKERLEKHVLFAADDFMAEDTDVPGLYAMADALFFPSKEEGFGLPLLEAMLHRLPVFCSDIPAHRELVKGQAVFFKLDDVPATITRQMRNHLEKDKARLRKRTATTRHGWGAVYEDYLEPLLGER